ncbi:MAG TPA: hypothetical protein VGF53_01995 [Pseudolabrys sp.]|jgi:hypothetical protein
MRPAIAPLGWAVLLILAVLATPARSQDRTRPPVGGVSSLADAMIFYLARGSAGACGPGCSEWIAAEGAVQWDSYKRLLALLARIGERKIPVILKVQGKGSLNVAAAMGKIIREHRLDVSLGETRVVQCRGATDDACFALKRGGEPLVADINRSFADCDVVCVLILAGGVHRTLPSGARVVITPTHITNRLAPNVSQERQEGLKSQFGDQFRLYLTQMGVSPQVVDIIDHSTESGRATPLSRNDWLRLGIVTDLAL